MSKLETFEMEYKGRKYLATEVENIFDPDSCEENVIFASTRLSDELIDEHGDYRDDSAESVDNDIYAYVDDEYFSLSKEEFIKYISENFN